MPRGACLVVGRFVGGEGEKCTLGLLCRGIDVEAKDAGHKVAGLADDPRILRPRESRRISFVRACESLLLHCIDVDVGHRSTHKLQRSLPPLPT
jgi:hypothetical protein